MTPDHTPHVSGSWWSALAGWIGAGWAWLAGGMTPLAAAGTIAALVLTIIKIVQEINAWRTRNEEHQVLRKLWTRMRSRPGSLDSRWRDTRHGL